MTRALKDQQVALLATVAVGASRPRIVAEMSAGVQPASPPRGGQGRHSS